MSLGKVFSNLGRKIDTLNSQSVIPDRINLKGKPFAVDFGVAMNKLGVSLDDFTLVKRASKLELAYKGKVNNLSGAIRALNRTGDVIGGLRELDIPPPIRNSAQARLYADKFRLNFKEQAWVKNAAESRALTETGLDLRRKLKGPAPDTPTQVRNALDQNPTFKKYVSQEIDSLNAKLVQAGKAGNKTFTVGKVVKTTFSIAGVALTTTAIISLVFNHMNNMNGCWLVNTISNSRCKVPLLTCDQTTAEKGTLCRPLNQCGLSSNQSCFGSATCVEYAKPTTQVSTPSCKRTLGEAAAKPCQGCNQYCNAMMLQLPPEYALECVNVNFWGALVDFVGGVTSNLYQEVVKLLSSNFLLYVAFILVGLIVYYMVSKGA